jgi:hypothetical protein
VRLECLSTLNAWNQLRLHHRGHSNERQLYWHNRLLSWHSLKLRCYHRVKVRFREALCALLLGDDSTREVVLLLRLGLFGVQSSEVVGLLLVILEEGLRLEYNPLSICLIVADASMQVLLDLPFSLLFLLLPCQLILTLVVFFNKANLIGSPEVFVLSNDVVYR